MGQALVLNASMPFYKSNTYALLLEPELTYTLNSPSTNGVDATLFTLSAYAGYERKIDKKLFAKARVGLLYKSINYEASQGSATGDSSEIGLALGAQVGYKIDEKYSALVGFNMLDGSDITHLTFGIQYKY